VTKPARRAHTSTPRAGREPAVTRADSPAALGDTEAAAGAQAGAPGPGTVGARRFLLCLYVLGFLVSVCGAGREVPAASAT
uniref:Uncharacterized protein n=1 Tax=Balaenoptera musculus TaxID=9771 RepID=A0A8C0ECQ0_BALMU